MVLDIRWPPNRTTSPGASWATLVVKVRHNPSWYVCATIRTFEDGEFVYATNWQRNPRRFPKQPKYDPWTATKPSTPAFLGTSQAMQCLQRIFPCPYLCGRVRPTTAAVSEDSTVSGMTYAMSAEKSACGLFTPLVLCPSYLSFVRDHK